MKRNETVNHSLPLPSLVGEALFGVSFFPSLESKKEEVRGVKGFLWDSLIINSTLRGGVAEAQSVDFQRFTLLGTLTADLRRVALHGEVRNIGGIMELVRFEEKDGQIYLAVKTAAKRQFYPAGVSRQGKPYGAKLVLNGFYGEAVDIGSPVQFNGQTWRLRAFIQLKAMPVKEQAASKSSEIPEELEGLF